MLSRSVAPIDEITVAPVAWAVQLLCPSHQAHAVRRGQIPTARIDASVVRIFRAEYTYGQFYPRGFSQPMPTP
jgi:hypothetical protein